MNADIPKTVGPYEIIEILAEGGMSVIYKANQPSLDRLVVVKVLPLKMARDPDLIARFERESAIIAQLNHPNIIQVIDRGEEAGNYYIVMEFVEGHSLDDIIRGGRIPIYQAVGIALPVARALEYAHRKGVIHRDIKPANVLVSRDSGAVKVTDFGIATIAGVRDTDRTLTQARVSMGTVDYMSPEQRRDARRVDERSDVFSFGVLLYEMLAGRAPVGRFRELQDLRDDMPPLLNQITLRCLHEDPADRYANFAELLADLQKLSEKELAYREAFARAAHSMLRVPRKAKTAITRRWGLGARQVRWVGLGALAVLAAVLVIVWFPRRSSSPPPVVVEPAPATAPRDAPRGDFRERFQEVGELLDQGAYDRALEVLRAVRSEAGQAGKPESAAEAQWRIAKIHQERNHASYAGLAYAYYVDTFGEVDRERTAEGLFLAGRFKAAAGDGRAAVAYLRRFQDTNERDPRATEAQLIELRLLQDHVHAEWGRFVELAEILLQDLSGDPRREEVYWRLSRVLADRKEVRDCRRAVAMLEEMAREFPQSNRLPLFEAAEIARLQLEDDALARRLYEEFAIARPDADAAEDARWWRERLR